MTKKITQADIFESYRAAQQLGKTEFAHALGMSKQSYSTYVRNISQPDLEGLQEAAVENIGSWIGDLCVDLLKQRGAAIPCVCQAEMWDNGPCPKHGEKPSYKTSPKPSPKGEGVIRKQMVTA